MQFMGRGGDLQFERLIVGLEFRERLLVAHRQRQVLGEQGERFHRPVAEPVGLQAEKRDHAAGLSFRRQRKEQGRARLDPLHHVLKKAIFFLAQFGDPATDGGGIANTHQSFPGLELPGFGKFPRNAGVKRDPQFAGGVGRNTIAEAK